ncbi:MAG: hypothetical protein IKT34_03300, partial [Clostridia bacterium]|nr:hypothetical protein [Clostridia bacterium]
MLNKFLEKFKKCSFSGRAKETISKMTDFSVKVDRENMTVAVLACFSCYIEPKELFLIENEIKKGYGLNGAFIYPKYDVEFEESHMNGVIETLKQRSQLEYGFFDDSTFHYDRDLGEFKIMLRKYVTSYVVETNGAVEFIESCVRDRFGVNINVIIDYEDFVPNDYVSTRENELAEAIKNTKFEIIQKEEEKDPPRSSLFESKQEDADYFELGDKRYVTLGKMTLDITEPEPIYGERRNWNFTPISLLKKDTGVCVAGKLFLVESKENYEGEKITFTLYITDNEASVSGRFTCKKSEAPKLKPPMYVMLAGKAEHRRIY